MLSFLSPTRAVCLSFLQASFLEDRCERLDREKTALGELLATKKREYSRMDDHYSDKISDLEERLRRSTGEKNRLMDKLKVRPT